MMLKDFPADDMAKWKQLMQNGKYMLTEAEPAMDAASAMRFGRDVFVQLDHVRN